MSTQAHRRPTRSEKREEYAALFAIALDAQIGLLLIVGAIFSGSYTLIGESVRGWTIFAAVFFSFLVQVANNRNRRHRYELGVVKLEQLVWLVLGLSLLITAPMLLASVVNSVFSQPTSTAPIAMTIGALINAANLLINIAAWLAMLLALSSQSPDVFKAQFFARTTILITSAVVQLSLTGAAFARDASVAVMFDSVGALFVACIMVFNGSKMVARSLPGLLDASVKPEIGRLVRQVIATSDLGDLVTDLRTRRFGPINAAELALPSSILLQCEFCTRQKEWLEGELRRRGVEVEFKLVTRLRKWPGLGAQD